MLYDGYLDEVSRQMRAAIDDIAAHYNFTLGDEFEIAICKVLARALPERAGVCRGFVVTGDGRRAGDDIIIFDRSRFPRLTMRGEDGFARKESVPIEAVYGYIEAKHALHLEGNGKQSLAKALGQIGRVRELLVTREPVRPGQVMPLFNLNDAGLGVAIPPNFPQRADPPFTMLFARKVRLDERSSELEDPEEIRKLLGGRSLDVHPDLIVAGENVVVVPVVKRENGIHYQHAFFTPGISDFLVRIVDRRAFGIALVSLLAAIEWIQLGRMPLHAIIAEGLDAKKPEP